MRIKSANIDQKLANIYLWDSLVDESKIQKSFYQGASCIFLVFDIVKGFSFDKVENQLKTISENCKKSIEIALIGNKSDLVTD